MQTHWAIAERDGRQIELLETCTPLTAPHSGFTLLELCVVIAAVALVGMTMLPALARTRPNTGISQCFDNAKQLAIAIQMYTADNHDLYPPNPISGTAVVQGYTWCYGNVQGGMPNGPPANPAVFSPGLLTNSSTTLVAPYLNGSAAVFSCPADPRMGPYAGGDTNLIGHNVHAVRSISMNGGVGTIDPGELSAPGSPNGVPNLPVPGVWLTGGGVPNMHDNPWATFGKTADFRVVKPAQIFLTTDEDPYSINDSALGVSAGQPKWIDYPATYHDHGCTMSFCDGHVELHRWVGSLIVLDAPASIQTVPASGPDFDDWTWLWQHATVKMK